MFMETKNKWIKKTSSVLVAVLISNTILPSMAIASVAFNDGFFESEFNDSLQYTPIVHTDNKFDISPYVKKSYIAATVNRNNQTIKDFHSRLLQVAPEKLVEHVRKDWIPITGDITFFIPQSVTEYPLEKRIGDKFVQRKIISTQVKRLIGRNYISDSLTSQEQQIETLYNYATEFALESKYAYQLGDSIPQTIVNNFNKSFIWPEYRVINNDRVLVPIVHMSNEAVDNRTIEGTHTVEFKESQASFKSVQVKNSTLSLKKNSALATIEDLVIGEKSTLNIDDSDVKIFAGITIIRDHLGNKQKISTGTLFNYGEINAERNVNIVTGEYIQKTLVHRYATVDGFGERLGKVSSINSGTGIKIESLADIALIGTQLNGGAGSITLNANGNIFLGSTPIQHFSKVKRKGYDAKEQSVNYLQTRLTTEQNIELLAKGKIELYAAQLLADKGIIALLANNGITIHDDLDKETRSVDVHSGKNTDTIRELETIVIRSALDAGKGIVIRTETGDITLKAVEINSENGTKLTAKDGKLHLLLAKEQDHYYRHTKRENFWRIKTRTEDNKEEVAYYNAITGGVIVNASKGLVVELEERDDLTSQEVLDKLSTNESLAWVAKLHDEHFSACPTVPTLQRMPGKGGYLSDGSYDLYTDLQLGENHSNACESTFDIVYKKLENYQKLDRTHNLTPQAMAIIAIAMAVAMGPGGFELIGTGGKIGAAVTETTLGVSTFGKVAVAKALEAGALTLATQAATSLASGNNVEETLKHMIDEDSLRSLATSMVTAAAMSHVKSDLFTQESLKKSLGIELSIESVDLLNQSTQVVISTATSVVIQQIISGKSFSNIGDQFKQAIKLAAVNELGSYLTDKITYEWHSSEDNLFGYFADAASGCLVGALKHSANKETDSNAKNSCASAAAGNVAGRLVANKVIADKAKEEFAIFDAKLKTLVNNTNNSKDSLINRLSNYHTKRFIYLTKMSKDIDKLAEAGADITKLSVALAVFLSGGSVDEINSSAEHTAKSLTLISKYQKAKLVEEAIKLANKRRSLIESNPREVKVDIVEHDYEKLIRVESAIKDYKEKLFLVDATFAEFSESVEGVMEATELPEKQREYIRNEFATESTFDKMKNAAGELTSLGSIVSCRGDATYGEQCNITGYAKTAKGLLEHMSRALNYDSLPTSSGRSAVQELVGSVFKASYPVTDEVVIQTERFEKLMKENPNAAKALEVIFMLASPIQTATEEVIMASPLGPEIEKGIVLAHGKMVDYIVEGTQHLDEPMDERESSRASAGGLSLFELIALGGPAAIHALRKMKFSRNNYESTSETWDKDSIVNYDGGHVGLSSKDHDYIVFDVRSPEKIDSAYALFKKNNPGTVIDKDSFIERAQSLALRKTDNRFVSINDNRPITSKAKDFQLGNPKKVVTNTKISDKHLLASGPFKGQEMSLEGINIKLNQLGENKEIITERRDSFEKGSDDWNDLNKQHAEIEHQQRKLSETQGLIASELAVKAEFGDKPGFKLYHPQWPDGTRNTNIDMMYEYMDNGTLVRGIVESKGGNSGLGKRLSEDRTEYVQQGTPEYHASLVADMERKMTRLGNDAGLNDDMMKVMSILSNRDNKIQYNVYSTGSYDGNGLLVDVKKTGYKITGD